MSKFLIAVYRSPGFEAADVVTPEVMAEIDALNIEMEAAGVRVFTGGLQPKSTATTLIRKSDGSVTETDGALQPCDAFVDGFWVVEVASKDAALHWARNAAKACRASVEVRPFY